MTEVATEYSSRFEVYDAFKKVAKTGDILFRRSDARGAFGLPFMRLVANATKSPYTHAAICYWDNSILRVAEVTDTGVVEFRFIDWYTLCIGQTFAVYRQTDNSIKDAIVYYDGYVTRLDIQILLMGQITKMLDEDCDYDFNFDDPKRLYCTEAIWQIYKNCGFNLCEPSLIKDIVSPLWYPVLKLLNGWFSDLTHGKQKLPLDTEMIYVGPPNGKGLAGSPLLEKVYEK